MLLSPVQDFSIGFVLVPVVCGLTLGQIGGEEHGENFFYQLQHSHVSPAMRLLLPQFLLESEAFLPYMDACF